MLFPSATVLRSSPIAACRPPLLGVLLTGLGVVLLAAGLGELGTPARPVRSTVTSGVAVAMMPDRVTLAAPPRTTAGDTVRVAQEQPLRLAACLGADLATGRRAESMHLATVAVLRPAECGDLRDAIKGMATLPYTGQHTNPRPQPTAANPQQDEGIDFVAAALYGPPDRQPQATQEALLEGVPDGGRGRVRDYLEEAAASRFLAP